MVDLIGGGGGGTVVLLVGNASSSSNLTVEVDEIVEESTAGMNLGSEVLLNMVGGGLRVVLGSRRGNCVVLDRLVLGGGWMVVVLRVVLGTNGGMK